MDLVEWISGRTPPWMKTVQLVASQKKREKKRKKKEKKKKEKEKKGRKEKKEKKEAPFQICARVVGPAWRRGIYPPAPDCCCAYSSGR